MNERLNERQKRFVDYYCQTGRPVEAARLAGYSHPHVQCARLIKIDAVKVALEERLNIMENERIASLEEINTFWTDVIRDANAETKDRLKASELRGKVLGAFIEKREITADTAVDKFKDLMEGLGMVD